MVRYKKLFRYINSAIYVISAAMLMAGLAFTVPSPKVAEACHDVPVCDVPSYTSIIVGSDFLSAWFTAHPEDFEIKANKPCTAPPPEVKVTLCHATSSATNPYNEITVSGNSLDNSGSWMNGHGKDPDDIWAAFTLRDGTPVPAQGNAEKQAILANHCVIPPPVLVCHVPGYTTESMSPTAWAALQASDQDDFLVDATHPCSPPITYTPVCDVPTAIDGVYSTIQVADNDLAAWLAAHPEDHTLASNPVCAPTTIDVCVVPGYTLTSIDQLFLQVYLVLHPSYFVPTPTLPCSEPTVLVCKVPSYETETMTVSAWELWFLDHQSDYTVASAEQCQPPEQKIWICHVPEENPAGSLPLEVTINAWNDATGAGHKGHAHDFEITGPTDTSCPPATVQYCHYDGASYQWSQVSGYPWEITQPDYQLGAGESCPVKSSYCRYDAQEDAYTQVELYPADITRQDTPLPASGACPLKVQPTAECVWNNGDGSVDAVFGYTNTNSGMVTIPIGLDNDLSGSGMFLGGPQPENLAAGTIGNAFVVSFLNTKSVSWLLKSPGFANSLVATASDAGAVCKEDPKKEAQPILLIDPYCYSVPGDQMQWTVENDNEVPFTVDSWTIDAVLQSGGFVAPVGESLLTTTPLGTHKVDLFWGLVGHTSLQFTLNSCELPDEPPTLEPPKIKVTPVAVAPLPIPVTGEYGGEIIPVTGADLTPFGNMWIYAGFAMFGLGLIFSGLRRRFGL